MKSYYDKISFTGETILELSQEYIKGSVSASYMRNAIRTTIPVEEIGGKYVSLLVEGLSIPKNGEIQIQYQVKENYVKLSEIERIKRLEERVDKQEIVIQSLLEGMRTRIDIQTFNTWLKSVETQLGVDIIAQQFSTHNR